MIISCASLALADAGILMYDLVSSVSVVHSFFANYFDLFMKPSSDF